MRIGRTLAPAAAPLELREIATALLAMSAGERAVTRFQEELKEYYGVGHAFLLSSGKAALTVILLALKDLASERDEVLIPSYTCYSVPAAIVKAGLKVRLCDVDPETLDYDWALIAEELDRPRLLCVVTTHLFGLPADVDRLRKLSAKRKLPVVEDAAQAMGGEVDSRKIGTLGDVGLFSLGRGKALSTVSGGIIVTGSDRIGSAIRRVYDKLPDTGTAEVIKTVGYALALCFLIKPRWYWLPKSLPFLKLGETVFDPSFELQRLGSFQAALAKGWQHKLAQLRETRRRNAALFLDAGLSSPASGKQGQPNVIKLPVLLKDETARKAILRESERLGLGISAVYPSSIAGIPELEGRLRLPACPQGEKVARSIVTLPVHHLVAGSDIERVLGPLSGNTAAWASQHQGVR